jgi:hypothetical protein
MNRWKASSTRWAVALALISGLLFTPVLLHRHAAAQGPSGPDREAIKSRMGRHGASLTGLGRAVVLLDLSTTARLARQIADEELVARSLDADRKSPDQAAESFGALREELRARAARLATEAGARNDLGVADAFGELAKTCVRCHRLYLYREGRPRP